MADGSRGSRPLSGCVGHRLGGGKSRVAGEDTPELLRERSPTPEPPVKQSCTGSGAAKVA